MKKKTICVERHFLTEMLMKRKARSVAVRFMATALAVLMLFSLAACGEEGNPIKITIMDGNQPVVVEGTDGMTVKGLLVKAGIPIDGRDSVDPPLDVRWSDAGAQMITVKHYAKVRVINDETGESKEVELVGGTVERAIAQAGFEPAAVSSDVDKNADLTDGMEIHLKTLKEGLVTSGGKSYLYINSELQKGGVVGNETTGFYYADDSGMIDMGYCNAVNSGGSDWNVINGEAYKVVSESDAAMFATLQAVGQITNSGMTKEEKLRVCFDHLKEDYLEGVRHDPPYLEMDWPVVYCNDIFVYGKGDCYSYGAAFAYMARAIGYNESYACTSGGHGWAEVDGLFYDPEWDMHHNEYNHYGVAPDDPNDVDYSGGISPGAEWMHIRIEVTGQKDAAAQGGAQTSDTQTGDVEDSYAEY